MAASDSYKDLGLDSNLYRLDGGSQQRLTAADLEVLIADSELLTAKIGNVGANRLAGGTLGQNESIVGTDGEYRVWKLGRLS